MYQYDMDKSEGRWEVEKFKYMGVELFKQLVTKNSGRNVYMHPDTAAALHMCLPFEVLEINTKEDYTKSQIVGRFCGARIYIDENIPPYGWDFRTSAENLFV